MKIHIPEEDFASAQEVAHELSTLSPADHLRIKRIAQLRSMGLPTGWEDLVNEAMRRMLSGGRRWPKTIPFVAFVAQTIRSIASEEWRKPERDWLILESDLAACDDEVITLADISVNEISPERQALAEGTLRQIHNLFSDDEQALQILNEMALGGSPLEIQDRYGMTSTQYASAQKRIRRAIAKYFGGNDD